jgi:phage tail-like protein
VPPTIGQLLIRQPDNTIRSFPLSGEKITIGRNPENTLQLDHPLVSRHHAELHVDPQGLVITDLGSANGTFVGSDRMLPNQPQVIAPGVAVHIGPFTLIFQSAAQQPEPQVPQPPTQDQDGEIQPEPQPEPAPPTLPIEIPAPPPPPVPVQRSAALSPHPQRLPIRDQRNRYLEHLPTIFQDNEFLNRYLLIFESIWEPLEQREDYIEMYFDPRTCPTSFLPWLASWLGMSLNRHWPEARCRQLLAEALDLYHWRGTRYGLTRMIKVCTGLTPEIIEDPAQPFFFRVRILETTATDIDWALIEELVNAHKPAHAGYVLEKHA